jgi:hypothetical protein
MATLIYNEDVKAPRDMTRIHAAQVVEGLAGPNGDSGHFGCDKRWMAFPNEDENLDELWEKYYNNKSDYLRVLKPKRTVDPTDVFTPNRFGAGAARKYGKAQEGSPALTTINELSLEIREIDQARRESWRSKLRCRCRLQCDSRRMSNSEVLSD